MIQLHQLTTLKLKETVMGHIEDMELKKQGKVLSERSGCVERKGDYIRVLQRYCPVFFPSYGVCDL